MGGGRVHLWVGGRGDEVLGHLAAPHIPLPFSPSISASYLLLFSLSTCSAIYLVSSVITGLECCAGGEGGREGALSVPLTLAPKVLAGGQPLLAAIWEELAVVAEEKNLAGR